MDNDTRRKVAERALGMVDLTDLTDDCTQDAIDKLCARAQTEFGPVGAVCIWPEFVAHAKAQLEGSGIPIATVVNFPKGDDKIETIVALTKKAIADGAEEIDLVLPYRDLLNDNESAAGAVIVAIRSATARQAILKVIIEAGELKDDALIRKASEMAIAAGADFIKTSTGKVPVNATPEFAKIMIQAIADSDKQVGFKPAGGIKTTEDCGAYLEIADRIMGARWATNETFRFGASSVLDDLLAALDGRKASASNGY